MAELPLPQVSGHDARLRAKRGDDRSLHRARRRFLDRGELERVMEAESGNNERQGWFRRDYKREYADDPRFLRRRHRGFLCDLFDD